MTRHVTRILALIFLASLIIFATVLFSQITPETLFTLDGIIPRILFVLVVILEVIIAPIPGGIIAFLAAAAWGFWNAWPLQYIGNVIGGLIVFSLSRTLGREWVERYAHTKKRLHIERRLEKHSWAVWFVYAIPVFPIDLISITLGLTKMRFRTYLLIILTALPFYTGITAYLGASLGQYIPYLEYFGIGMFMIFIAAIGYTAWWMKKR